MKRFVCFIVTFILFSTGCGNSIVQNSNLKPAVTTSEGKFSINGFSSKVDGNNILVEDNDGLKIYDLVSKKLLKEIPIPGKQSIFGYYISGDIITWSDTRNETRDILKLGGEYNVNADIFIYNIKTGEQKQITKDKYNQGEPKIYCDYIVWMDERRGTSSNDVIINGKSPNSDIFIYSIKTKKEQLLTGDEPQVSPSISSEWVSFTTSRQINPIVEAIRYK